MVLYKKSIFTLVALIATHLILAQDSSITKPNSILPAEENQNSQGENSTQSRFLFTRFVGCNYTAQAGRTCSSCRQTLLCLSNNIGIVKTCHGFLPYCNGGRCSYIQGSACNSTSG